MFNFQERNVPILFISLRGKKVRMFLHFTHFLLYSIHSYHYSQALLTVKIGKSWVHIVSRDIHTLFYGLVSFICWLDWSHILLPCPQSPLSLHNENLTKWKHFAIKLDQPSATWEVSRMQNSWGFFFHLLSLVSFQYRILLVLFRPASFLGCHVHFDCSRVHCVRTKKPSWRAREFLSLVPIWDPRVRCGKCVEFMCALCMENDLWLPLLLLALQCVLINEDVRTLCNPA